MRGSPGPHPAGLRCPASSPRVPRVKNRPGCQGAEVVEPPAGQGRALETAVHRVAATETPSSSLVLLRLGRGVKGYLPLGWWEGGRPPAGLAGGLRGPSSHHSRAGLIKRSSGAHLLLIRAP